MQTVKKWNSLPKVRHWKRGFFKANVDWGGWKNSKIPSAQLLHQISCDFTHHKRKSNDDITATRNLLPVQTAGHWNTCTDNMKRRNQKIKTVVLTGNVKKN